MKKKGLSNLASKTWWDAALTRALKTLAQTALASIGVGATLQEVNIPIIASTVAVATVISLLTSLAGLPEVEEGK